MRPLIQKFEWAAQEARKCDLRIQAFGAAGVDEPACQVFFRAWDRADADFEAAQEAIEQAITRTEDTPARRQAWAEAERRIMHAFRQIGEVMDHVNFLREVEQDQPTPPKGKKPPKKK